jgi:hypothetical protein
VHHGKIKAEWERLTDWMVADNYKDFSEAIGFRYCDETLGKSMPEKRKDRDWMSLGKGR